MKEGGAGGGARGEGGFCSRAGSTRLPARRTALAGGSSVQPAPRGAAGQFRPGGRRGPNPRPPLRPPVSLEREVEDGGWGGGGVRTQGRGEDRGRKRPRGERGGRARASRRAAEAAAAAAATGQRQKRNCNGLNSLSWPHIFWFPPPLPRQDSADAEAQGGGGWGAAGRRRRRLQCAPPPKPPSPSPAPATIPRGRELPFSDPPPHPSHHHHHPHGPHHRPGRRFREVAQRGGMPCRRLPTTLPPALCALTVPSPPPHPLGG